MAGVLAVVFFIVAFILYLAKATTSIPWTVEGFTLLGLIALAGHLAWGWWGSRTHS